MSAIFASEASKAKIAHWYRTFREALPLHTEARRIETPYGVTHVLVAGPPDAPPLVCLHGALASSAHVLPELGPLLERHRVYAVDVLGQSVMSADARLEMKDDSYARWLEAVCAGLGLARFVLFGVSFGGFVAQRALARMAGRVSALVLLMPAGVVNGPVWRGLKEAAFPLFLYRMAPSQARLARVCRAIFTKPDARWTAYFGDAITSYRLDVRVPPLLAPEDVTAYRGPTLVFGADEDLSFPGRALLDRSKQLFPHAELELIEHCKHCPPLEDAFRNWLAARVTRFLSGTSANHPVLLRD